MHGWAGTILVVDLAAETIEKRPLDPAFARDFLGGRGFNSKLIYDEFDPAVKDPFSPQNVVCISTGALGGTLAPASGRITISVARSPVTGVFGDGNAGGHFGPELKHAGYDTVLIKGAAKRPLYLSIMDDEVELKDASRLWGKTVREADDMLRTALGDPQAQVFTIGPAGENRVAVAIPLCNLTRAPGGAGTGAVLGSKNLKAVVVRGKSKKLPLFDAKRVNELARWGAAQVQENGSMRDMRQNGTANGVPGQQANGTLPTRNISEGQFEHFADITGEHMTDTILVDRDTCYACATHCKRLVECEWQGRPVERRHGGPEYETIGTYGSYLGINSLAAIAYANKLCNEYGLDTIGTGATIGWAMECYEKGVLSEREIGFPLPFGDEAAAIRLTEMIVNREGFGDVLAEGSQLAAAKLGKGQEYLITWRGAETPAHMPQAKLSLGLIYAVNPFGADHQSSEHDFQIEEGAGKRSLARLALLGFDKTMAKRSFGAEKARFVWETQKFYSFCDSACLCQFDFGPAWTMYGPDETVELMRAVTGWQDFALEELLRVGERRINMMRVFNAREGMDRRHDQPPAKFLRPLVGTGPTAGVAVDTDALETAKDAYFQFAGWDKTSGNPSKEHLVGLGLGWLAEA